MNNYTCTWWKKIKSVLWVCATRYPRTWSFSLEKGKFFKVSCSETENWVSSWACVLKITRSSKRLVSKNFENQFQFFKLPAIIESIASAERNWTVVVKLRMSKCLLAPFNRSWVILKIALSLFELQTIFSQRSDGNSKQKDNSNETLQCCMTLCCIIECENL